MDDKSVANAVRQIQAGQPPAQSPDIASLFNSQQSVLPPQLFSSSEAIQPLLEQMQFNKGIEQQALPGVTGQMQKLYGSDVYGPETTSTGYSLIPEKGLVQKYADLAGNPPPVAWQPHNPVARALVALATATRPGQAIQSAYFGPGLERWGAQKEALASQIKDVQGGIGESQKLLETGERGATGAAQAAGMASYHEGMLNVREQANQIRDKVANGRIAFQQGLLNLDWSKLGEAQRHNRMDEMLQAAGVDVRHEGNMVLLQVGTQRTQVDADKFNAAILNKDQGFFDQVFQSLGWKEFYGVGGPGGAQVQPMTPGGQSTQPSGTPFGKPPTPKRAAPSATATQKPGSGEVQRYVKNPATGEIHPLAKGYAVPKGWTLVPAPTGAK